jgi:hypothetical protein
MITLLSEILSFFSMASIPQQTGFIQANLRSAVICKFVGPMKSMRITEGGSIPVAVPFLPPFPCELVS